MAWLALVVSGLLETAWAISLDRSAGFSRPVPTVVFAVTLVLSMAGLAYALREIPVGTGYAVWVGIGAVGTATVGILALGESSSLPGWPACCWWWRAWWGSRSSTRPARGSASRRTERHPPPVPGDASGRGTGGHA